MSYTKQNVIWGAVGLVAFLLYMGVIFAAISDGNARKDCQRPIEHTYLLQGYDPEAAYTMARIECR